MDNMIGVESAHGFGDCLFNAPLIKSIKEHHGDEICVGVRPHCKDAFYNLPWIDKIIEIPDMNHGANLFKKLNCSKTYQITQNVKFFEFREQDHKHSLIDTPTITGRQLKLPEFDPRPIFMPTEREAATVAEFDSRPTIAIESVYKSAQSWAKPQAFTNIVNRFKDTHRILWLSNENAPQHKNVDNMLRYTRREVIMCLQLCDIFFSVGSGFFCSSLALPSNLQPKKIVCLWVDDLYRYEKRLTELNWHPNITWLHHHKELDGYLR